MQHSHRTTRGERLKLAAKRARQRLEAKLQELERRIDAGAVIEDGPLMFDRELRRVVPNPDWKGEAE